MSKSALVDCREQEKICDKDVCTYLLHQIVAESIDNYRPILHWFVYWWFFVCTSVLRMSWMTSSTNDGMM